MCRIFTIFSGETTEKMSSRLNETTSTSVAAVTVALRGMSYITASSPKKAPFLSCDTATSLPSNILLASQTPFSMTYNISPMSPSRMIVWPARKLQGLSLPTNIYCSALPKTSCESRGILAMCWRSSCSTLHTAAGGSRSIVTSVSATSVQEAVAALFVKHSTPKNSPGVTRGGVASAFAFSSVSPGSSHIAMRSPGCSDTMPFSKT
mmetsp:Transcript_54027/g.155151  ORF Transcript_54027/g.155151 Transcript_54027/m.155151 type:complete len:207 (+) Transcript_54027:785-1405(+)